MTPSARRGRRRRPDHGVSIENLYYLLCYALDSVPRAPRARRGLESAQRPAELICDLLCDQVERLLRRGLARDYVEHHDDVPGVRGRIDLADTVRRRLARHGRTSCRFTTYDHDTPPNRVLATVLSRLARTPMLDQARRVRCATLHARIHARDDMPWRPETIDRVTLHRHLASYAFALQLCRLIVCDLLPHTRAGDAEFVDVVGDARWLGSIFEGFARGLWRRELDAPKVVRSPHRVWDAAGDRSSLAMLPDLRTDIELAATGGRVIVEAKCYRRPLGQGQTLRPAHVNQLAAYLVNAAAHGERIAGGMLLYAQADAPIRADVELLGYPVRVRSVDLDVPWHALRARMLEVGAEWVT